MRRSSRHAVRASSTISGRTPILSTLFAARSTTPITERRSEPWPALRHPPDAPGYVHQLRGGQCECIRPPDRMTFEKYEVRLCAPLPLRDRLKRIDVPADETRQCPRLSVAS